jgi:hypothetical protein
MVTTVPFHTNRRVELAAHHLLNAYGGGNLHNVKVPIPIEQILELHLQLVLSICDLQDILGYDDVLGNSPETTS